MANDARAQTITEYSLPAGSAPIEITSGPDGNLWFTEDGAGNVGRITTSGVTTLFPTPSACAQACGITTGPNGNLWFSETGSNQIGQITTTGTITQFSIPNPTKATGPFGITTGSDGALWFMQPFDNTVGRLTTSGTFSSFTVPTSSGEPVGITGGRTAHFGSLSSTRIKLGA